MKRLFVILTATLFTILAFANIASACTMWSYQPEVPKKLLKE